MKRKIAIYPGTFDPITFGHIDVIDRAAELFQHVIVLVAKNTSKAPLFTIDERLAMIREVLRNKKGVSVDCFDGLLVEYAGRHKAGVIVRGLRAVSDFEYEFQMALTNRKLAPAIDTVFLVPREGYTYLNSSIVREVARLGGDVSDFVPGSVQRRLTRKLRQG
ncbi:MAG: phosphopantetheine adenylyltransferase [Bacteroidetes bacterium]|jgi:pantetheine-phosphate adenylyltransferase|nr:phosphopantetheine adenylyltransferase [Bacteroidota bacterium]